MDMLTCKARDCENQFPRSGKRLYCCKACAERERNASRQKGYHKLPSPPTEALCAAPGCQQTFRRRGRQIYCSKACAQRTCWSAWKDSRLDRARELARAGSNRYNARKRAERGNDAAS